jgi:hypothetical protein
MAWTGWDAQHPIPLRLDRSTWMETFAVKNWRSLIGTGAALCGVIAVGSSSQFDSRRPTDMLVVASNSGYTKHEIHFTIEGRSVNGLYPGALKGIPVKIYNPYGFAVKLQSIQGRVTATSRRRCSASPASLVVKNYVGNLPVAVAAQGRTSIGWIPVTMPKNASAQCSGTVFSIALSGRATKASR